MIDGHILGTVSSALYVAVGAWIVVMGVWSFLLPVRELTDVRRRRERNVLLGVLAVLAAAAVAPTWSSDGRASSVAATVSQVLIAVGLVLQVIGYFRANRLRSKETAKMLRDLDGLTEMRAERMRMAGYNADEGRR